MIKYFAPQRPSVIVALADTADSQRLHHRLRYQVYCQRLAYEDPTRFPDGEERDCYDEHAVQFIAYDVRRADWVGTLRLIPPDPLGLPMTSLAGLASHVVPLIRQRRVAEISRMCVAPTAPSDASSRPGGGDSALAFFALIRASVAYACRQGFDHLAFLTTLSLSRLLGRMGIADQPAGDGCHHHGVRYPRIADVVQLYRTLVEAPDDTPYSRQLAREPFVRFSALVGPGLPLTALG